MWIQQYVIDVVTDEGEETNIEGSEKVACMSEPVRCKEPQASVVDSARESESLSKSHAVSVNGRSCAAVELKL